MKYWKLCVASFHRQTQYRLALLAGLATNVMFGFIRASILYAAVDSAGGTLGSYDKGSVGAYVWISQGLLGAVHLGMGVDEVSERIRSGDIAIELVRPVDIQLGYLAADLGRAAFSFLPRGVPSVLVGALTFGLVMPSSVLPYALGLVSIALAVAVSFLVRFVFVSLPGFWLVETRGLSTLYVVSCTFLAGLYVPVSIFPDWLRTVAQWTPFPSMLQTPVDVLSGRIVGSEALLAVAVQLCWLVVALAAGWAVLAAARQKLVVQGG